MVKILTMKKFLLLATLFSVSFTLAQKTPIKINAENGLLKINQLKPGVKEYLVYFTDGTKTQRTNGDIWKRETSFKKHQGKDAIFFKWTAFANGKPYRQTLNICDAKTLSPIHHKTTIQKIGDERIDARAGVFAYDFHKDKMVPSDSIQNNRAVESGPKPITIPIVSWEQDLETFPLLPITKVGEIFDVAFFDPNEKSTQYHQYFVSGKEKLKLNEDTSVECWVLENHEGGDKNYSKFWMSTKSKEVLKMEQYFNGNYRFKVLQF